MDKTMAEEETMGVQEKYRSYTKRKVLFVLGCLIVTVFSFGLSVTIGNRELSVVEVYEITFKHIMGTTYEMYTQEWYDDVIVWDVRVPRALFAIVAGAGLAIAGSTMQSVMKNPLADPYTVGISSGACFGVAVAEVLGIAIVGSVTGNAKVFNAFLFALIPMFVVIAISPRDNVSPATIILAGVAISYLFNSMTTILLSFTDAESLANIYEWQLGTVKNINWDCVWMPLIMTLAGSAILILLSRQMNILSLGDAQATSLGLNVKRLRFLLLIISSLVVAGIVAFAGIIGFVGLIAPHIVRLIIDSDNKFVIPGAAMFGGAFFLLCDTLNRHLFGAAEVPVGVIISFIGAPIFLLLIVKQSRSMW